MKYYKKISEKPKQAMRTQIMQILTIFTDVLINVTIFDNQITILLQLHNMRNRPVSTLPHFNHGNL
jgi:hypothetical protein